MGWWYLIVFGYLVLCWRVGPIHLATLGCAEEETKISVAWSRAVSRYPLRVWICCIIAILLLSPFLPMFWAYWYLRKWRDAWRNRTHRTVTFEQMRITSMPRAAQDHIERCEPYLQELGFTSEGSYLLNREAVPIYGKCFISWEGESVVDVSLVNNGMACSFTSVLENGHVLETAWAEAISPTNRINTSGPFTADMVEHNSNDDDFSTLYQRHRESLVELERRFESRTIYFQIDQVKDVMSYANWLLGKSGTR